MADIALRYGPRRHGYGVRPRQARHIQTVSRECLRSRVLEPPNGFSAAPGHAPGHSAGARPSALRKG